LIRSDKGRLGLADNSASAALERAVRQAARNEAGLGPTIARTLGIAPSTVKTHVLHLFEKTGCARQADLLKLAASLSAPA